MHKGSELIFFKIGKTEAQKENCRKPEAQSNFAHAQKFAHCVKIHACANFFACAKFPASNFRLRTTPFCIFSNFTPNVITIDMGILVFHFFVRLYIAILCTVKKDFLPMKKF